MLPQLRLDRTAGAPLHHQLTDQLRRLVLSGQLSPGTRLPPTRRAAVELGVSRNVVVLAYEELRSEGYLRCGVGAGTWVSETLEPHLLGPAPSAVARDHGEGSGQGRAALSLRGRRLASLAPPIAGTRPTRPFRPGAVAADLFPTRTWLRLHARAWRTRPTELVQYGDVRGWRPLREALAEHLRRFRAVRCEADQILVTAGSQQSLDLAARMLIDPGDRAGIEEPGYPGAAAALAAASAELVPVPVDGGGLDVEAVPDGAAPLRVVYVTPSHQFPLGVTMALGRRLALLDRARRAGSWILEDDYDSEFRFEGRPLPSLQGLDAGERVVYVGTFSKVLAPGLRVGFMVLPGPLVDPFVAAREVVDHHPPITIQAALAEFIAEGHLERHVARMRGVYAERRDALRSALVDTLGDVAAVVPGEAGLHLTLLLGDDVDDAAVSSVAASRALDAQPLSAHYVGGTRRPGLVLGYAGFPPEELAAAVPVLRDCIAAARRARAATRDAP